MPDTKSKFLGRILDDGAASEQKAAFTRERQHSAQAFNLHVERRDGRHSEGFGWSHYVGYRWTDEGDRERLVVLFGTRAVEIEGHHLGVLVNEIREGQLSSIRELASRQVTLLEHGSNDNEPVIASVKLYPDFEEVLKEIKGEEQRETRYAKRLER